jgi:hypothetical protein
MANQKIIELFAESTLRKNVKWNNLLVKQHLLTQHEPGNELHIIPEISVPGGSVDYVLASVKSGG